MFTPIATVVLLKPRVGKSAQVAPVSSAWIAYRCHVPSGSAVSEIP